MAAATTNTAAKTLPFPSPANSGQYAEDLDEYLDAPLTTVNEDVLSAWVQSESATFPGYNGLGTTLPLPGSTPVPGNSANVQEYPTLAEGLAAAADMMLGQSPQTTPLAAQFVSDLRSGTASEQTLTTDVLNSGWDGSGQDTYDATAIASKLGESDFSAAGSSGTGGTGAQTTGILSPITNALGGVASSAASSILGTVGLYVLKGIISLTGAAIFVYGAKLTTERGPQKQGSSSPGDAGAGSGIGGEITKQPREVEDAFPEAAPLAAVAA
jgi:hypothetical protein